MIWGLSNGDRIKAEPNKKAICDICNEELIAKCGSIKVWHWAHKVNADCDTWGEHETEWHLNWKNEFPKEQQEIVVGKHRADIKINEKVIELQNSSISPENIEEREKFYKDMIWVLNGETLCKNFNLRKKAEIITFRWKHPAKSWWAVKKPIYIDFSNNKTELENLYVKLLDEETYLERQEQNHEVLYKKYLNEIKLDKIKYLLKFNGLFLIKKLYSNIPCGGWGILLSKEEFLKQVKNGNTRN